MHGHEPLIPDLGMWATFAPLLLPGGLLFIVSPLSNILNLITIPLGYEWQSCPFCPAVGIKKITWAECEECGDEHRENFGAAKYIDGDRHSFCSIDCMDSWKGMAGETKID